MSARFYPRAGTRPDVALRKLAELGGRAGLHGWMSAMEWMRSAASFEREIIASLTRCHVLRVEGAFYVVTQKGRDFIDGTDEGAAAPVGQVAGPRLVVGKVPLSARHMVRAGLVRDGALDYAQIPSRYGDQRVEHKAKVRTA